MAAAKLCGGRQIIMWRPPHKLDNKKYFSSKKSGINGLPYQWASVLSQQLQRDASK